MPNDAAQVENRILIVGAGHVGATAAYALMLRALFREIVLIDENEALARSEAADIGDANALARPTSIRAGSYADSAGASLAVITAGAATHGSESRLSVAAKSAEIVRSCVDRLMAGGFNGVLLVAANPVDLMALAALKQSGLPSARVIGTGTLLDSARLQQEIARRLGVSAAAVDGLVLGEHGDSEVVAFSALRVGGIAMRDFAGTSENPNEADIARTVRDAAYEIVAGKGYTSFGVATAIVRLCEAIVRDERAVLPASTLLTGQLGIDGLYLSMPCMLGEGGIQRVITPVLSEEEAEAMRRSAATVREAGIGIGLIED